MSDRAYLNEGHFRGFDLDETGNEDVHKSSCSCV
jgi:hypothetical protein